MVALLLICGAASFGQTTFCKTIRQFAALKLVAAIEKQTKCHVYYLMNSHGTFRYDGLTRIVL